MHSNSPAAILFGHHEEFSRATLKCVFHSRAWTGHPSGSVPSLRFVRACTSAHQRPSFLCRREEFSRATPRYFFPRATTDKISRSAHITLDLCVHVDSPAAIFFFFRVLLASARRGDRHGSRRAETATFVRALSLSPAAILTSQVRVAQRVRFAPYRESFSIAPPFMRALKLRRPFEEGV